jgi:chaperonin cofactor prefoldin
MSLLGFDNTGVATLNGLNNINANFVYSDELYYDTSTIPVNVKTAIDGISIDVTTLEAQMVTANSNISTLQGQMTTANSNISTLQGQMTTANSNISTLQGQVSTLDGEVNTLQSEMNTAQSEINTLQSEMNTAQSDINDLQSDVNTAQADITALYVITTANTASIVGLSISQASQDVIISAHSGSIATLQGEMNTAQADIVALEVVTNDQSWGTLTGTRFSRQVHISNNGVSVGTDAVYLDDTGASTFLYGLTASGNISTTGTLTSSAGTSTLDSLNVNNNFEVTNLSYFGDTLFLDRNVLTSKKKLVLYDNSTDNDYDYLGFWTDSGATSRKFLNCEIDGNADSAFQWYYGNDFGTARTLLKKLNQSLESTYCETSKFVKSSSTQEIALTRDIANNKVLINMVGDTTGVTDHDGQIIQELGNGVDDNRGTMTIKSGNLNLTAETSATTGTLQMNSKVLDINVSASTTIDSATTTTLTSVGETEINCSILDINASGVITIDGGSTTAITSVDDMTLQTTNPFGDILITSAGTNTFTSVGQTQINSGILDINATGAVTLDSTSTIAITGTTNTILGTTNINATGGENTNIGNTGAIVATGSTITTTSSGTTQINSGILDINATATASLDATAIAITASTGNMTWTTSAVTGDFNITSGRNINFSTNTTGGIMNCTSNKDQDIFKVNNTSFDSKFVIGSTTTGFRQTVNNNSYANLDGLGTTEINIATNNADITLNAGGGNTVIVEPVTMFNMMPTASIITRVINSVPSGFLACDGGAISRATYSRLFSSIGTTFGVGDGSTTFNKPDFEGAFLRGAGSQTVGGIVYAGAVLGTAQQDSMLQAGTNTSTLQGYYNVDAGGGGSSRQLIARTRIATDPIDACSVIPHFTRENTTEVRPFNYSVYYYIRY